MGTALKPAHEPVILARKPLIGTVAANVGAWGTGALRIDESRIEGPAWKAHRTTGLGATKFFTEGEAAVIDKAPHDLGRWPANVLLDEQAAAELDAQSGTLTSGLMKAGTKRATRQGVAFGRMSADTTTTTTTHADSGGASRFFYVAKPSRRERDQGCDHLPAKSGGEATDREDGSAGVANPRAGAGRTGGKKREVIEAVCAWGNEARKVQLLVDTEASPPRVTGVSGAPATSASAWSTILFGSASAAPFPRATTSITETRIDSTTGSKIWKRWRESLTSGSTAGSLGTASPAGSAGGCSLSLTTTAELTGSLLGVAPAASPTQWRISGSGQRVAEGIKNHHCTVKPVDLMRYLVRLVTPPGGCVLDPFTGSGTTGMAARLERLAFVGIEREPEYATIAAARIASATPDTSEAA